MSSVKETRENCVGDFTIKYTGTASCLSCIICQRNRKGVVFQVHNLSKESIVFRFVLVSLSQMLKVVFE